MSYVNLHSHITNRDVQYGLIEFGLKYESDGSDYGNTIQYAAQWWNRAPEAARWPKIKVNNGKHQWGYDNEIYTMATITGRSSGNGINGTGNLTPTYSSVYRGSRPIISNKVFTVDEFNSGDNTIDLFSTDVVDIKLYVYKGYVTNSETWSSSYNITWQDEDGNYISDEPEVLLDVEIRIYKKDTQIEIGRYAFIDNNMVNTVFNKFTISTELFDLINLVNTWYNTQTYDYRYGKWYDDNSISGQKIHQGEEDVVGPIDHVVLPAIVLISLDYYSSPRSYYNYKRCKIVKSDGSDLNDTEMRRLASSSEIQFIEDQIDNNQTSFIKFVSELGSYGAYTPSDDFKTYINDVFNSSLGYKTKVEGGYQTYIVGNDNFQWSPLLLPLVDTNHNYLTYNQSAVFFPITTTVIGGDPEPPEPGPEEDEEADDPDTEYDPDPSDGEESYTYPISDTITGEWDTQIPYESSYNNYVFADFKRDATSPYSNLRAYEMIMEVQATSLYEWFVDYFGYETQIPLADIITRVYECPISFVDLFQSISNPVGAKLAAPVYGYSGPLTMGRTYNTQTNKWEGDPLDVHYYYCATPRIFELNLGAVSISQVFHNYLDYETKYTLNLPYGGGSIDIDPEYLFPNEHASGSIILKGYFDLDTGTMLINVKVTGQMYYQTIVNMASDKVVSAVNVGAQIANEFKTSVAMGLALGGTVNSLTGAFKALSIKSGAKDAIKKQRFEEQYGNQIEYRAKSEAMRVEAHRQDMENEARLAAANEQIRHQNVMEELREQKAIARIKHNK